MKAFFKSCYRGRAYYEIVGPQGRVGEAAHYFARPEIYEEDFCGGSWNYTRAEWDALIAKFVGKVEFRGEVASDEITRAVMECKG